MSNLSFRFVCNSCGKQFIGQEFLRKHILMIHENLQQQEGLIQSKREVDNYPCDKFDYEATTQSNQTTHIETVHEHEGGKYACNQCEYEAGYQSDLKKHMQSKHEGVKYACNQCDKQFTHQSNLKKHIKRKHL